MDEERRVPIHIPVLTRVEGEGALDLSVRDGRLEHVRLRIFEPPRYFEKLIEGRHYSEVPDIVARICGICPVAYQMSAVHALESIFETQPGPWVREMRRLLYCGEWLESHGLHIHLLAAPDFLGYPDAVAMAREYRDELRRGLQLQALGNGIIRLLGGRSVHPVGTCVGGFYRAPSIADVSALRNRLHDALPLAEELVQWAASLALPDSAQDFTCVAVRHPNEYPLNEGTIAGSDGLSLPIAAYEDLFQESHQAHSTALYSHYRGQPYLVGPLARVNLNLDRLPPPVRRNLERSGVSFPSRNMFHSIVARAAEMHYALVEALRIMDDYRLPEASRAEVVPRAGVGYGCTEAPRGMLWQRWETNDRGEIVSCRIVPPTSQNQARMEEDLRSWVDTLGIDTAEDALRQRCEAVLRNYDPCISCATHFLRLRVHRD